MCAFRGYFENNFAPRSGNFRVVAPWGLKVFGGPKRPRSFCCQILHTELLVELGTNLAIYWGLKVDYIFLNRTCLFQ